MLNHMWFIDAKTCCTHFILVQGKDLMPIAAHRSGWIGALHEDKKEPQLHGKFITGYWPIIWGTIVVEPTIIKATLSLTESAILSRSPSLQSLS